MFLRHRYMADYSKGIMAHGAYIANIRRLSSVAPPAGRTPPHVVRSDGLKQARCLLHVILLPERQAVKLFQGHAKNLLEVSGREVSLKREGAKHFPREAEHFLQLEDQEKTSGWINQNHHISLQGARRITHVQHPRSEPRAPPTWLACQWFTKSSSARC